MKRQGFTFIEVLAAAAILVMISMAFASLLSAGLSHIADSQKLLQGVNTCGTEMERIRSKPFSDIRSSVFDGNKGKIEVVPVSSDLIQVTLTYNWKEKRKPIEIYTMRSRYR